jgi:hypothetical protein
MKVTLIGNVTMRLVREVEIPDETAHDDIADMAFRMAMETPYTEWDTVDLSTDYEIKADMVCRYWHLGRLNVVMDEEPIYLHKCEDSGDVWYEEGPGLPPAGSDAYAYAERYIAGLRDEGYVVQEMPRERVYGVDDKHMDKVLAYRYWWADDEERDHEWWFALAIVPRDEEASE